jgi:hypothetical protein
MLKIERLGTRVATQRRESASPTDELRMKTVPAEREIEHTYWRPTAAVPR